MARIVRGATSGRVMEFSDEKNDRAVVCKSCTHIIISENALKRGVCSLCGSDPHATPAAVMPAEDEG